MRKKHFSLTDSHTGLAKTVYAHGGGVPGMAE